MWVLWVLIDKQRHIHEDEERFWLNMLKRMPISCIVMLETLLVWLRMGKHNFRIWLAH